MLGQATRLVHVHQKLKSLKKSWMKFILSLKYWAGKQQPGTCISCPWDTQCGSKQSDSCWARDSGSYAVNHSSLHTWFMQSQICQLCSVLFHSGEAARWRHYGGICNCLKLCPHLVLQGSTQRRPVTKNGRASANTDHQGLLGRGQSSWLY